LVLCACGLVVVEGFGVVGFGYGRG